MDGYNVSFQMLSCAVHIPFLEWISPDVEGASGRWTIACASAERNSIVQSHGLSLGGLHPMTNQCGDDKGLSPHLKAGPFWRVTPALGLLREPAENCWDIRKSQLLSLFNPASSSFLLFPGCTFRGHSQINLPYSNLYFRISILRELTQ